MEVLQAGRIGVSVIVNAALHNRRKRGLAVILLRNMAAMIVLVKLENYRTASCLIVLVTSITQLGLAGVHVVYRVAVVCRLILDIV